MLSGECRECSGRVNTRPEMKEPVPAWCLSPTISRKHYQIIFQKPDYFSDLRNMKLTVAVLLS